MLILSPGARGATRRRALVSAVALLLTALACAAVASRAQALPANLDQIRAAAAAQAEGPIVPGEAGSAAARSAGADADVARDLPELEQRPDPGPATIGGSGARLARAQSSLARRLGPLGVFALDRVTGTPRYVARLDGALTAPSDADAADIALGYVGAREPAFGLGDSALGKLELDSRYTTVTGMTTMHWTQSYQGIELVDSGLAANVDDRGRLINVLGSPSTFCLLYTSPSPRD